MSSDESNPYAATNTPADALPPDAASHQVPVGINRREFAGYFALLLACIAFILIFFESFVPLATVPVAIPITFGIVGNILLFLLFSRRYQNIGWNKWLGLNYVVPVVNLVALFQCLVLPQNYARSRYLDSYGRMVALTICVMVATIVLFILLAIVLA